MTTTITTMRGKKTRQRRWGAVVFYLNFFRQLEDPWPNTHLPINKHINILCRPPPWYPSSIISKCICPNCPMYLNKFPNVFVQISKCICPNCQMYLSRLPLPWRPSTTGWEENLAGGTSTEMSASSTGDASLRCGFYVFYCIPKLLGVFSTLS